MTIADDPAPIRTLPLVPRPLSVRAFKSFGQVLTLSELGDPLSFEPDGERRLSARVVQIVPRENVLRVLTCHPQTAQLLVPLARTPYTITVGPISDAYRCRAFPGTNEVAAFTSDGSHAVWLFPGVWHTRPFVAQSGLWLDLVTEPRERAADESRDYEAILRVNFSFDAHNGPDA